MGGYESRLDRLQREFGNELQHLRETVLKADAQAAALRLTAQLDTKEPTAGLADRSELFNQGAGVARLEVTVAQLEDRLKRVEGDFAGEDDGEWVEHSSPTGLSYFYNAKVRTAVAGGAQLAVCFSRSVASD